MSQKKTPPPSDFQSRVQAYEAARKKGLVFQADGTYGGTPLRKKRRRRSGGRLFAVMLIVLALFSMKSVAYFYAGPVRFNANLAGFANSDAPLDRAVVFVLQPDPATIYLAEVMGMAQIKAMSWVRQMRAAVF